MIQLKVLNQQKDSESGSSKKCPFSVYIFNWDAERSSHQKVMKYRDFGKDVMWIVITYKKVVFKDNAQFIFSQFCSVFYVWVNKSYNNTVIIITSNNNKMKLFIKICSVKKGMTWFNVIKRIYMVGFRRNVYICARTYC